jgi:Holliday junction resolvase-like predicted endonuclease
MPTIDYCQHQVVRALQKVGWTVAPKPQRLVVGRRVVYIDLVAKQSNRKVFIEVKCFADPDSVHEQYVAIGQYLTY